MPLHLLKLCVGAESIEDLEAWIESRRRERAAGRGPSRHGHVTRMAPRRAAELLNGGSLYWVIKGQVAARQALLDIETFTDADGIGRCRLVLDETVVPVRPRPFRPFQGWRYLPGHEAPEDLAAGAADLAGMPEEMQRELRLLGLL